MAWRRGTAGGGGGVAFGPPTNVLQLGDAASEGAAATALRSDAVFAFPDPATAPPAVAAASAEGADTAPARSDHTHELPAELVHDLVAALVAAGANVTVTYDDVAGTLTIAVPNEGIDDRVAALLTAGANIALTYDDGAGTLTIAVTGLALSTEDVHDIVGALIVDSAELDATYDDVAGTISLALKPGSVALSRLATDPLDRANHTGTQPAATVSDLAEAVDDRVAALLTAGANIALTYNDAAGTLTIAATGGATVGDLLDWQLARAASNEDVTSSTTLQDDDAIAIPIGANESWEFLMVLSYGTAGDEAVDVKQAISVPAGATLLAVASGHVTAQSGGTGDLKQTVMNNTDQPGDFGVSGGPRGGAVVIRGVVLNAGTAGNIRSRWAQVTSSATVLRRDLNSYAAGRRFA